MGLDLHPLRRRFVDSPESVGSRLRVRRWQLLVDTFPDLDQRSIIDLGGSVEFWARVPVRPAHVHVINLEGQCVDPPLWAEFDRADACQLPGHIRSRRYDLVFSNSVIEHVGGHERRVRFADNVRTLADSYWVQTPYRYFPIEPHYVAPGLQFLPMALRVRLVSRWPLVHSGPLDRQDALRSVLWTDLLDRTQMRAYFPCAALYAEKIGGLTKSLIAIGRKER